MAPSRSRSSGREHARSASGGVAAEHATKIYPIAIVGIVVVVAFLALTSTGHVIDAATQHFMLFYAGVFVLIALCTTVGLGLVSTDRIWLNPGHRVLVQAAHRATAFGAVSFLIVHIVTEILAQRVHVLDAVIPFLSPFRTFYIGLGTIASDLIILLVITGIMRSRFNASGKAWRWRAIHYTAYLSFVFGIWHGLLAGRPAKPYVDWSYGFVIAFVVLGLAVRVLSESLKPKESLSAPPVAPTAASATAPLRAAAMLASMGGLRRGSGALSGPQPVLSQPLSAPVVAPLPAAAGDRREPYYEPGYEGPARYLGAPRNTGTGPMPRMDTGPMPRMDTGPMPRMNTGPMPRAGTGPLPRMGTGPMPLPPGGPVPPSTVSGPLPRMSTGPLPRIPSGPFPRVPTGAFPEERTGPYPQIPAGPSYPAPSEPRNRPGTGPIARAARGDWMSRTPTGPQPRAGTGPVPRVPRPPTTRPPAPPGSRTGSGPMQAWPDERSWPGEQPRPTRSPMRRDSGAMPQAYPAAPGGWAHQAPMDHSQPGWVPSDTQPNGWPQGRPRDGDRYPGNPEWDDDLPLSDPYLKYRQPGPGMPGYRGSSRRPGGEGY